MHGTLQIRKRCAALLSHQKQSRIPTRRGVVTRNKLKQEEMQNKKHKKLTALSHSRSSNGGGGMGQAAPDDVSSPQLTISNLHLLVFNFISSQATNLVNKTVQSPVDRTVHSSVHRTVNSSVHSSVF